MKEEEAAQQANAWKLQKQRLDSAVGSDSKALDASVEKRRKELEKDRAAAKAKAEKEKLASWKEQKAKLDGARSATTTH